jgi:S-DNA-T family DNA segregation ATPase FtsK/SpoIIIE
MVKGSKRGMSRGSKWRLPSLEVLSVGERHEPPQAQLQQIAHHIERTLEDHGVTVEVKDIKAGPRVVRFGLVPGWVSKKGEGGKAGTGDGLTERSRVKVQSILSREKDLALALKTPYIRLEAPVPGEALVGLEVPTPSPSKVPLRSVMGTPAFRKVATRGSLPIALGQDTGGNPVAVDLAVLPHLLIAGATGSGKSVCINTIVASLLLTKPPDQVRMLMVDPKRVELTPFNGIPHLIAPVIVEAAEVNAALRALMREMFQRYRQMEETGTRNISGYNAKAKECIPYLILIVDELADLMMAGGFEVEQNLVRLAQLGRATGIHLVLATQRPSVNVVTGLLKANIPARIAFAVASQVDSRVILDTVGAEKLLGKGDMLLLNHDSPKPRRVQGTLVTDEEINKLVDFWQNQKGPPLPVISIEEPWDEDEDGMVEERTLDQARELAIRNPHLSASFLERRLKIGGQRAEQIIELLEEEGLVLHQHQ